MPVRKLSRDSAHREPADRPGREPAARGAPPGYVLGLVISVAGQAALVASGPVLARGLGPDGRGRLALMVLVAVLAVQIGGLGLPLSISYHLSRPATAVRDRLTYGKAILVGLAGVVALSCVSYLLLAFFGPLTAEPVGVFVVAALIALSGYGVQVYVATFQGTGRLRSLNVARLLPVVLSSFALALAYLAGVHFSVGRALVPYLGANLVTLAVLAPAWWRAHGAERPPEAVPEMGLDPLERYEAVTLGQLVGYGWRGMLGAGTPLDTLSLDQSLVGLFLSPGDLGIYAVANAVVNLPALLYTGLSFAVLPAIAGAATAQDRARAVRTALRATAAIFVVSVAVEELIAGFVISWAFGSHFDRSISICRLLIPGAGLLSARRAVMSILFGLGHPAVASRAELGGLVLLVATVIPAVTLFGLAGACVAIAIVAVSVQIYLSRQIRKY